MEESLKDIENENEDELIEEGAERRTVNFMGNPLTLLGHEVKVGDKAPDFKAVGPDLLPMKFLRTYKGTVTVLLSFPSFDTEVCDLEGRRFNKEAAALGPNVNIVAISMDLPFAQKRWCAAAGIKNMHVYSDYYRGEFGKSWGVYIKEQHLLARAVFIVNGAGIVHYAQIVPEMTKEPDYNAVIASLRELFV